MTWRHMVPDKGDVNCLLHNLWGTLLSKLPVDLASTNNLMTMAERVYSW